MRFLPKTLFALSLAALVWAPIKTHAVLSKTKMNRLKDVVLSINRSNMLNFAIEEELSRIGDLAKKDSYQADISAADLAQWKNALKPQLQSFNRWAQHHDRNAISLLRILRPIYSNIRSAPQPVKKAPIKKASPPKRAITKKRPAPQPVETQKKHVTLSSPKPHAKAAPKVHASKPLPTGKPEYVIPSAPPLPPEFRHQSESKGASNVPPPPPPLAPDLMKMPTYKKNVHSDNHATPKAESKPTPGTQKTEYYIPPAPPLPGTDHSESKSTSNVPPPPPPPPGPAKKASSESNTSDRGALLNSIRSGMKLKKGTPASHETPKQKSPAQDLMSAIRSDDGQKRLKHTETGLEHLETSKKLNRQPSDEERAFSKGLDAMKHKLSANHRQNAIDQDSDEWDNDAQDDEDADTPPLHHHSPQKAAPVQEKQHHNHLVKKNIAHQTSHNTLSFDELQAGLAKQRAAVAPD